MSTFQVEQTLEDYRYERGDELGVFEPGTGFLLFNDGAMAREIAPAIHGQTPISEVYVPTDETERRRIRIRFMEASIAIKTQRYNTLFAEVSLALEYARVGAAPVPDSGWEEELKRLAEQIEHLRELLDTQVELLPEVQRAIERDRQAERRAAYAREQSQLLRAIPQG